MNFVSSPRVRIASPLLAFATATLGLGGCEAETYPLGFARVTLHLEDAKGEVSVLLSGPDGAVYDVVSRPSPGVSTVVLPGGGSITTRFEGPDDADQIRGVAGLTDGAEVVLRPTPWSPPSEAAPYAFAVKDDRGIEVDVGCGSRVQLMPPGASVRRCGTAPGVFAFRDGSVTPARYAITAASGAVETTEVPGPEAFVELARRVELSLDWGPFAPGVYDVDARGLRGDQSFSALPWPGDDDPLHRELAPVDLDLLRVAVIAWVSYGNWAVRWADLPPESRTLTLPQLPLITVVEADRAGVRWALDGEPATRPVLSIHRVTVLGLDNTRAYPERRWEVGLYSPSARAWSFPELPPELSDWRIGPDQHLVARLRYPEASDRVFDPESWRGPDGWVERSEAVREVAP